MSKHDLSSGPPQNAYAGRTDTALFDLASVWITEVTARIKLGGAKAVYIDSSTLL